MIAALLLLPLSVLSQALPSTPAPRPLYASYPATKMARHGSFASPVLKTRAEREFRSVLNNAVKKGYGVVEGGTEQERPGPNFGGHYVLVQWSCGLDCEEAAIIDGNDGTVLPLPLPHGEGKPNDFHVAIGAGDLRALQFQTDSNLLGIPSVADGKTLYFVLNGHAWQALGAFPTSGVRATLGLRKGFFGDATLETIDFQLQNDTDETIKPQPESWRLMIDGQDMADPGGQLWMGGRPSGGYKTLGPGQTIQFGKALSLQQYFPEAREYKVYWTAATFSSNVVSVQGGTEQ